MDTTNEVSTNPMNLRQQKKCSRQTAVENCKVGVSNVSQEQICLYRDSHSKKNYNKFQLVKSYNLKAEMARILNSLKRNY